MLDIFSKISAVLGLGIAYLDAFVGPERLIEFGKTLSKYADITKQIIGKLTKKIHTLIESVQVLGCLVIGGIWLFVVFFWYPVFVKIGDYIRDKYRPNFFIGLVFAFGFMCLLSWLLNLVIPISNIFLKVTDVLGKFLEKLTANLLNFFSKIIFMVSRIFVHSRKHWHYLGKFGFGLALFGVIIELPNLISVVVTLLLAAGLSIFAYLKDSKGSSSQIG